ncbi:MAG: hypothetical protein ACK4YM_02280 [Novosphingobium sp.]
MVDAPDQGTIFPSAGGNSASPRVQAVYWRCLVALFASARISNPDQRLALFCNVRPPVVDGIDIAAVLERYGVELRLVPLTARLPQGRLASWGNVLYFFDILTALEAEDDDLRFALVDSDVLVTAPLDPLWALLDRAEFVGYVVETGEDEPINGMTRRSMAQAAEGLAGRPFAPLQHFGGELFATTIGAWKRNRALFDTMLQQASNGVGPASGVLTEEHIFSIAFALLQSRQRRRVAASVASAGGKTLRAGGFLSMAGPAGLSRQHADIGNAREGNAAVCRTQKVSCEMDPRRLAASRQQAAQKSLTSFN